MRDQATSLRELKAEFDRLVAKPKQETPKAFLARLKRQSPLSAIILIYPDELQINYPDVSKWLPSLVSSHNNLLFWDQANILKNISTQGNNQDFAVLTRQPELLSLQSKSHTACYSFLESIADKLGNHNEVWITLKASEISYYQYMINSANALCIMLPDSQTAIIKCYESIKTIYGIKKDSFINLLEFSSKPFLTEEKAYSRIKNVAKQFLGIDLTPLGVVLSNGRYFPPINEGNLSGIKIPADVSCGDFMYSFGENIVYNTLGMN